MIGTTDGWTSIGFGHLLKPRYGKALAVARRDPMARYPVVGSAGVMTATEEPLLVGPVVVIGRKGNVGQVQFFSDGCWPIDTTYFVTVPEQLDAAYLTHYLGHLDLGRLDSSTATPSLRREDLEAQTLRFPELGEQRRIVEILEDHLAHLEAAARCESSGLRRAWSLREELVRRTITGTDVVGARVRSDLPDAGSDDGELATLPEGWRWRRLGDIAEVVGGVTKDAKKQSAPGMVEVPYLRVANVQRGALKLDGITSIRVAPQKAEALKLQAGDVLLNEGGDRDKLARGWVWEQQVPNCIHQNHVFRARLQIELDPYFLSWTANTIGGRWAERNGKQSVNLASISLSMIRRMPVIVPPNGLSTRIVVDLRARLEELERLENAIRRSQARTVGLRRALLAAAFQGKLTGRHTDNEVIEELADV